MSTKLNARTHQDPASMFTLKNVGTISWESRHNPMFLHSEIHDKRLSNLRSMWKNQFSQLDQCRQHIDLISLSGTSNTTKTILVKSRCGKHVALLTGSEINSNTLVSGVFQLCTFRARRASRRTCSSSSGETLQSGKQHEANFFALHVGWQ